MFLLAFQQAWPIGPYQTRPQHLFTYENIHTFFGRLSRIRHRCRAGARGCQGRLRVRGPRIGPASEKFTFGGFLLQNPQIDFTLLGTHYCLKKPSQNLFGLTRILFFPHKIHLFYLYLLKLSYNKNRYRKSICSLFTHTDIRGKASTAVYSP